MERILESAEGDGGRNAATGVVARDGRNVVAELEVRFADVQCQGDDDAQGRDPVTRMAEIVEEQLAITGAEVTQDGKAALRRAFSRFTMSGVAPRVLDVPAKAANRPTRRESNRDVVEEVAHDAAQFPPELFERVIRYPSPDARARYERLIGLDEIKTRLVKEAIILTQPKVLSDWARRHHKGAMLGVVKTIGFGTPLVIFAGDVGTGKSVLAETFGAAVADELRKDVLLLRMSIATRGKGFVGDMTQQIVKAIGAVEAEARRGRNVTILLVDEADAMAESRETKEMHHEDRAGVNALIQGIDRLRGAGLPVLVVFCTNRLESLDPAIQRRAVDVFLFQRPDDGQRLALLEQLLDGVDLRADELAELVTLTASFTYSDISDRFLRAAVTRAFPDRPLTFASLRDVAQGMEPTRAFTNEQARG